MAEKKYPEQVTDNAGCIWTHGPERLNYSSSFNPEWWVSEDYVLENPDLFTPVEEKPEPVYRLTASQLEEYGTDFQMLTEGAIKEFLSANGHDPEPEQPFHHYILPPTYGLGAAWKAAREGYSFSEWCSWLENHDIGKTGKPEQPQPVELLEIKEAIDRAYTEYQGYYHLYNDGHKWASEVANKFMHIVEILKRVQMPQPEPQTGFSKTKLMEYLGNYPEQYSRLIAMIGNGEFDGAEARN